MDCEPVIDTVDTEILKCLLKDARCDFTEIAKKCNLSVTAITQRYRKLKRNGIITGTTLMTKCAETQHSLSVDITAESDCEKAIVEAIKKLPRVLNCFRVIGKYDIHAAIRVESLEEIDQIKNTIKQQPGVLRIEIAPSLDPLLFHPENLLEILKTKDNTKNG